MAKKTTMLKDLEHAFQDAGMEVEDALAQTRALLDSYGRLSWLCDMDATRGVCADHAMEDVRLGTLMLSQASAFSQAKLPLQLGSVAVMVDIMTQLAKQVGRFPVYGDTYGTILQGAYLDSAPQSDMELCEALHLERTTYYSRKREAVLLFGYLLITQYLPQLQALTQTPPHR